MTAITNEILEANGFLTNHPERELRKYYTNSDDARCRIEIKQCFVPQTNEISYNIIVWKYGNLGALEHQADVKYVKTIEDAQAIIDICDVPFTFEV